MPHADSLVVILQEWIGTFMRRSMHGLILYTKENELSMSQIGALFQINRGKSNVSDLGEELGITLPAASQMLERLVQQGLILRSEDPQDRRARHLILTDKGCRIIRESVQARQGWLEDLSAILSASEKEQVVLAVKLMIKRTHQLDQPPNRSGSQHFLIKGVFVPVLRLAKYLKPYLLLVLMAVVLLFVQANADLALPDYMSNIVNYGIQQGGVQNAVPLAIRQSEMDRLVLFMSPGDKALVVSYYTLVDKNSPDYKQYVKNYPALANEPIYVLKPIDQADIS
jgi:DNA-binding MarR family transcriptional regulator